MSHLALKQMQCQTDLDMDVIENKAEVIERKPLRGTRAQNLPPQKRKKIAESSRTFAN